MKGLSVKAKIIRLFNGNLKAAFAHLMIFIFLLSGCGYSIQKKSDIPFSDIHIGKINNNTFEPKLQDKLYRTLVGTFSEYGFNINPASRYRLEGDITKFEIKTLSEKELITTEYQILLFCNFRLIDTQTGSISNIEGVTDPFVKYFIAKGKLENVLAQKEIATESSLRDLSKELVRYIIHKAAVRK